MWMKILLLGVAAASVAGPTDVRAAPGTNCPMVKCMAPNCPESQRETPKTANGCPLCPVCKGVVLTSGNNDCALILCLPDFKCVDGKCVSSKPATVPPVLSAAGTSCALILCLPDTKCVDGKCVPNNKPAVGKGKAVTDLTAVVCPKLACIKPPVCAVPLENPIVNGCPTCPKCPCHCGDKCTMGNGNQGVCQPGGECAVNIQKPVCPKPKGCTRDAKTCPDGSKVGRVGPKCEFAPCPKCVCGTACKTKALKAGVCQANGECKVAKKNAKAPVCACVCGESCKMTNGGLGTCQVNGDCAQNIVKPQCPAVSGPTDIKAPPGTNCPVVKCTAPNCPESQQETPKTASGCPLCPVCKGVSTVPPVLTSPPGPK